VRPGEVRLGEVRRAEVRPGEVHRAEVRRYFTGFVSPGIPGVHPSLQPCEMVLVRHRACLLRLAMGIEANFPDSVECNVRLSGHIGRSEIVSSQVPITHLIWSLLMNIYFSSSLFAIQTVVLTRLFLRLILAPHHHDTAAAYAVLAEEHMPDAHNFSTASSPYERSPTVIPLSRTAPTPHPLSSPPRREGHLADTSWSP
jgi:hypothetical protein